MPWHMEPADNGKVYVVDDKGKHYSEKPIPKWRAKKQMAALYAAEPQKAKEFIEHTGAMVALPVPEAFQLVQGLSFPAEAEVLPAEEMHVTLAFFGDVSTGNVDPEKLFSVVEEFVKDQPPIIGKINGYGIFTETHLDGMECLWLSLDAPGLPEIRQALIKTLAKNGFTPADNHGFTPHITVAYYPKGFNPATLDFEPQSVMILALRVAWAELVRAFPFGVVAMNKERLLKDGLPASAFLVVEDPTKVTTWHLPVKDASGKPDRALMGAAHAALMSPGGHRGQKYEGPGKSDAIAKLRKMYETEGMKFSERSFSVFKQADGQYRWVTISSSAFRDRDGEIVTARALADDVTRCDTTKDYGPLRWWHVGGWTAPDGLEKWQTWKAGPGIDLGTCDFNMLHGKMLIESGTFKDSATGEAFADIAPTLEVSIAFAHPPDEPGKEKAYQNIHRFERSLMPEGFASNLLTKFHILKGEPTMKTTEKLAALMAILKGKPELAQQILADAEGVQKAAEAAGLETKEVTEMFAVTDEAAPVQEEVIQTPPADKQAAAPADETMMPDEIGDMTHEDLATFVAEVVKQVMGKKEAEVEVKQAGRDQMLADALASIKAIADRLASAEHTMNETQQSLLELTDARPVGIKQLQSQRPTERADNVIKEAPTGPRMDPEFMKFALGGK